MHWRVQENLQAYLVCRLIGVTSAISPTIIIRSRLAWPIEEALAPLAARRLARLRWRLVRGTMSSPARIVNKTGTHSSVRLVAESPLSQVQLTLCLADYLAPAARREQANTGWLIY